MRGRYTRTLYILHANRKEARPTNHNIWLKYSCANMFSAARVSASRFAHLARAPPQMRQMTSRQLSSARRAPKEDPTVRNYIVATALLVWVGGVYYYSIFRIKSVVGIRLIYVLPCTTLASHSWLYQDDLEEVLQMESMENDKPAPKNNWLFWERFWAFLHLLRTLINRLQPANGLKGQAKCNNNVFIIYIISF